jgi:hypothetical protein
MIAAGDRTAQQKLRAARDHAQREGKITSLNVKPTVGFTLPWAGVTPAPGIKKIAKWRGRHFALQFFFLSPSSCVIQKRREESRVLLIRSQ